MGIWDSMTKAFNIAKRNVSKMVSNKDTVVIVRRYREPRIDGLTGDPVYTSGNSYVDFRFPATVSEFNEYSSRIDREWTGELFKKIVVFIPITQVSIFPTDIFIVTYGNIPSPYKVVSQRDFNGRWRIDLERVDRAID